MEPRSEDGSPSLPPTRHSIAWRLNLWFAVYFIVTTTLLFLAVYWFVAGELTERDRREVMERFNHVRSDFARGGIPQLQVQLKRISQSQRDAFFVRLITPGEQSKIWFVASPEDDPLEEEQVEKIITNAFQGMKRPPPVHWDEIPSKEPHESWTVLTHHTPDGKTLQVGMLTENLPQLLAEFRFIFALALVMLVAIGVCGGMFAINRTLQPIRWLAETVRSILATRTLEARVPVSGGRDELAELSRLFNRMLDQQQHLIRSMHEALDNVAHDLRTPLTRLHGSAEVALQAEDNAPQLHESLQDCLEESERVASMLKTLMDISEAETGSMRLHVEQLDLAGLVRGLIEVYELAAEERQIRIQAELPESLSLEGDNPRLQQVVGNLLDNAIKYSPEGAEITVRLREAGGVALLEVQDHGIGIPAADRDRIWERLYRADKSRSRRGLGLGLSFVRAIVESHQGSVRVESEPGKGSTFHVALPLRQQP